MSNLKQLTFKDQIKLAIKELSKVPTSRIVNKLRQLEENLKNLYSLNNKIISLPEYTKIKLSCELLREVIRDRHGGTRPEDPVDQSKPRHRIKTRSKGLKII